jgi:hypothetical protein
MNLKYAMLILLLNYSGFFDLVDCIFVYVCSCILHLIFALFFLIISTTPFVLIEELIINNAIFCNYLSKEASSWPSSPPKRRERKIK